MGRRKAAPPPGYARRLGDVLASPLGLLLRRAALGAVLVLVGGLVMRQARAQAYRMADYRLTRASIRFVDLPRWADAAIRKELANPRYYEAFSASIFDPDAEAAVRGVVTAHPLVHRVRRITVTYPRSAQVVPELRVPVGRVRVRVRDGRGHVAHVARLLGDDRSLLPTTPYRGHLRRLRFPLPEIHGIQATGTTRIGAIFEERHGQVAEAVAAADVARRLFRDTRGRVHVRVVDVGRFPSPADDPRRAEVAFQVVVHPTRPGGRTRHLRLEWGRTERDCREMPHEDGYVRKLGRLERALAPDRRLPAVLDVRYPDGVD